MMSQKGFIPIVIIGIIFVAIVAGYFIGRMQSGPDTEPIACTQEAMLCPDGSYLGRTRPNCEFAPCPPGPEPSPIPPPISKDLECKKDSDCPSSKYTCEAIEGVGTVYPNGGPSTYTITKGVCKLKEGNKCRADSDCVGGLLCSVGICTSPIGRQCSGPYDTSCPNGFECVQGCGPPVAREDDPPAPYYCQIKGYIRMCPICLAEHTLIDTPSGQIPVETLQKGMEVWTADKSGKRIVGTILKTSKTSVPTTHKVIHLVLDDGRELFVSPGHPTADGRNVEKLSAGDIYDGVRIKNVEQIPYAYNTTYDILPSGETGLYWANGILMGSTLSH